MSRRSAKRQGKVSHVDLEVLSDLSKLDLKQRWEDAFSHPPPKYMRRDVLVRALAHEMQLQASGGMPAGLARQLARAARSMRDGKASAVAGDQHRSAPGVTIKPGTRLLRDWQGVTHEVIILEKGIQYRGREWSSLSAVAREITGTRWSGPLFFGLKGQNP
ncbi:MULTISPECIES: DUF2924 domain-containing protein [unclassified Minwuia]|uniref:DUF2924 domain-containing protein n=1 Tax=unclassified Minwuia TaxID=2618799 RepID=UPI0020820A44|nr:MULTISPECIES: DUF2924 domain-containing protein [unclassified Minwuia]GJL90296.1 MAG: hypothetical protein DHS20C03_40050 [Minwuia thermotolerans]